MSLVKSFDQNTSVDAPITKIIATWCAAGLANIGIHSWGDFASFAAGMYTLCLLGEFFWLRFGRSFAEARGWVKPLPAKPAAS